MVLELQSGSWESSRVASWGLGLVSGCDRELGIPLELRQGSWTAC